MDNHALSPELEKEARALCAKITVAHDLDAEIQEELFSHVEDKLLGYLQGEVPVSDADALLLARAHFGDPAAIKGLLGDVHAPEAAVTQWRRLAAAAIATLGCVIAARLLLTLVSVGIQYIHLKAPGLVEAWHLGTPLADGSGTLQLSPPLYVVLILLTTAGMCLGPWAVFHRWRGRLQAGDRPWFYQWGGRELAATVLGLLLLNQAIPFYATAGAAWGSKWAVPFAMFAGAGMIFFQCLAWVGWCDTPPHAVRRTLNTVGAWLLGLSLLSALPHVALRFVANPADAYQIAYGEFLLQGRFLDTATQVAVWWSGASPYNLAGGAATFVYAGIVGLVAVALYEIHRAYSHRLRRDHAGERPGLT